MLQNSKVTAFTVSELLRENQQGEAGNYPCPTQIKPQKLLVIITLLVGGERKDD